MKSRSNILPINSEVRDRRTEVGSQRSEVKVVELQPITITLQQAEALTGESYKTWERRVKAGVIDSYGSGKRILLLPEDVRRWQISHKRVCGIQQTGETF